MAYANYLKIPSKWGEVFLLSRQIQCRQVHAFQDTGRSIRINKKLAIE